MSNDGKEFLEFACLIYAVEIDGVLAGLINFFYITAMRIIGTAIKPLTGIRTLFSGS